MMSQIEIIWYKAYFDLKAEAARGSFGILWWILEPLLYLAALSVVFVAIRQRTDQGFLAFLFTGLVIWKWTAASISQGANAVAGHTGLMKQVYIPKLFFPLISTLVNTFKFFIVFCLLLSVLPFFDIQPTISWLALPLLILTQVALLVGVAFILSWAVCYIPDLKLIIDNSMLFLFFLSGIIFDISKAPHELQGYLFLNPVLVMVDAFRDVLLSGIWPDWGKLTFVIMLSLGLLILGGILLSKYDRKIPKVILR